MICCGLPVLILLGLYFCLRFTHVRITELNTWTKHISRTNKPTLRDETLKKEEEKISKRKKKGKRDEDIHTRLTCCSLWVFHVEKNCDIFTLKFYK